MNATAYDPSRREAHSKGLRRVLKSACRAAALACTLAACATSTATKASSTVLPRWRIPLASSATTPSGVWATVAMGHLQDPLNTFWQLPFRPAGKATWTNQVKATATATNGGLVLASAGKRLLVGIRPSVDLTYTPLIATSDGGITWSTGLIDQGLSSAVSALAVDPTGRAMAITSTKAGSQVVSESGSFSSWKTVGTLQSLDSSQAGKACDADSLTAVGYAGGATVIGASCTKPGSTGLFVTGPGGWVTSGPRLSGLAGLTVTALAAKPTPLPAATPTGTGTGTSNSGLAFLLGVSGPAGQSPHLVVAWSADATTWQTSPPIPVGSTDSVLSFGPTSGGGLFVVARGPGATILAYLTSGPGATWHELPAAPPGTATLAAGHAQAIQALAVNNTLLRLWTFDPSTNSWVDSQTMQVNIEFGSSNP